MLRHFRTARSWLRRWWRIRRNRCTICGGVRVRHEGVCIHCTLGIATACHRCNKRVMFGTLYGEGTHFKLTRSPAQPMMVVRRGRGFRAP